MTSDGAFDERQESSKPAESRPVYLGIEVGERGAWIAVASGIEEPVRRWRERFAAPLSADELIEQVGVGAYTAADGAPVAGIGVAVWGVGASAPDEQAMWWTDDAFVTRVRKRIVAPLDWRAAVDAAGLAEAQRGAGVGASPLLYVHFGREVRSALVIDGQPARGARHLGGLLGHWRVAEGGPRCACGATGHLDPLCSSQSFVRLAIGRASLDDDALARVQRVTQGRAESLTAAQVVALADEGVGPLRELAQTAADAAGRALGQLALVTDPQVIALGGPLGLAGDPFLEWTRGRVWEALRTTRSAAQAPAVVAAQVDSALMGAWLLGRELAGA